MPVMLYLKLYLVMLKVAALSFGGAYSIWALLEKEVAIECAVNAAGANTWNSESPVSHDRSRDNSLMPALCQREFRALFALSEVMPGPQVNAISVFIFRSAGPSVVLLALIALLTPGLIFAPLILRLYNRYRESTYVPAFFSGAVLAILSVLLLFFLQLVYGQIKAFDLRSCMIAAVAFAAFTAAYFYRVNPLLIVVAGGVSGYFFF